MILLPTFLLSISLVGGCVPRSERRVQALSEAAQSDPHATAVLVRALRVQDEDVWHLAYAELLALGPQAAPALRRSVSRRKPEAGRALLLLGEMGDPAQFDLLTAAERVPALRAYADQAWVLAEAHLYERILQGPTMELCEAYLESFPSSPGAEHVEELRYEQRAWMDLRDLGPGASVDELVAFVKRWRGTEADMQARSWVALKAVQQAEQLSDNGRPQEALARLEEARRWDPDVDTRHAEGRAREALGRNLASSEDLDAALEELEAARQLGSANGALLGSLYLERARARFLNGDPVGGMQDLSMARSRHTATVASADAIEDLQAKRLRAEIQGTGSEREAAVRALASAPRQRAELDLLVLTALEQGDTVPIEALSRSSEQLDAEGRRANNVVIDQALQNTHAHALMLLSEGALEPLLSPESLWSRETRLERAQALVSLRTYETAVRLAKSEVSQGRRVISPLPQDPVLSEPALLTLFERGGSARGANLPQLHRVQLLRWALEGGEMVLAVVRSDPASLAVALLEQDRLPEDLEQWRALVERARVGGRALFDYQRVSVSATRDGDTLRILVRVDQTTLPDPAVGALLNVLFSMTPLCMQGDLSLQKIEVVALNLEQVQLARLAMDRRSAERMNWELVASEAPYNRDHVAFLFDAELL